MALLRYHRHRFPPEIIQHAIWLYLRSLPRGKEMKAYRIERFGSVDGIELRSSDDSRHTDDERQMLRGPDARI